MPPKPKTKWVACRRPELNAFHPCRPLVAFIVKRLDDELALRDAPVKLIPPKNVAGRLWTDARDEQGRARVLARLLERVDVDLIRDQVLGFVQQPDEFEPVIADAFEDDRAQPWTRWWTSSWRTARTRA